MFLHLSDIHCEDSNSINNLKQDKIIDAIKVVGNIDDCMLVCSGDLALSGQINEYKIAKKFIGRLLAKLGIIFGKHIKILIVPGNHDLNYEGFCRSSDDIQSFYSKKMILKEFNNELKMNDNFMAYAQSKKCFLDNSVIESKNLKVGDIIIQANLINTSPFSTLKKDNKELHYMPEDYYYQLIKRDDANLSITIMHHSTEWFYSEIKEDFETILYNNSDIIFQGHEHVINTINIRSGSNKSIVISKGGEYSGKMTHESTFSTLLLDTRDFSYSEIIYTWNTQKCIFTHNRIIDNQKIDIKTNKLIPTKEFIDSFISDRQGLTNSIIDYFVFPQLTLKSKTTNDNRKKLNDEKIFLQLIKEKGFVNIVGKNNSGKTTFLKYLYNLFLESGLTPLYLGSDDFKPKRIGKLFKDLFEEQYGSNEFDYFNFEQLDISKKIVLVDDFDKINNEKCQESLLKFLLSNIKYLVFTTNDSVNINVIDSVKKYIDYDFEIISFCINDFFKEKRTELISNICKFNPKICEKDVDNISIIIDNLVQKRHGLFNLTPDFIIQYVKYFIGINPQERKGEAIFNVIYETNIRNAIINNSDKREVEEFLISLEEIAYYMHYKKIDIISINEIENIIREYNLRCDLNIDIKRFIISVSNAKLFHECSNSFKYEFCNKNYLAYFIAKKINKLIERNGTDIDDLKYIIKYICFGVNDTILMFLSYLRSNTNIALSLCSSANELLEEYEEIDFDKNNVSFLKRHFEDKIKLPHPIEKGKDRKRKGELEEKLRELEEQEIKYKGIYDYSEDDVEKIKYRIGRAIKYLELISKSLISQYNILEAKEKSIIIDCMYELPNKILYAILKPYDENFDKTISELKMMVDSIDDDKTIDTEKLEKLFINCALAICLSLYDDIAFCGSDKKTLLIQNKYNLLNSNYKIMNLLMESNGGSIDSFVEKSLYMNDNNKDEFFTYLIKLIVRQYVITHDSINHNQLDKLSNKLFSNKDKKNILLLSHVNSKNEK